jgi:hypothetical protein
MQTQTNSNIEPFCQSSQLLLHPVETAQGVSRTSKLVGQRNQQGKC